MYMIYQTVQRFSIGQCTLLYNNLHGSRSSEDHSK